MTAVGRIVAVVAVTTIATTLARTLRRFLSPSLRATYAVGTIALLLATRAAPRSPAKDVFPAQSVPRASAASARGQKEAGNYAVHRGPVPLSTVHFVAPIALHGYFRI